MRINQWLDYGFELTNREIQEEHKAAMLALEEGCWHDWEELQAQLEAQKQLEEEHMKV